MNLSDRDFIRYSRQVLLPEVGEAGQLRLKRAHALIIGVGGLGHLVAHYLAAAGVGSLTLVDGDRVEASNLPRQLLFGHRDLGQYKAEMAKEKLSAAYWSCRIQAINKAVTPANVDEVFQRASGKTPALSRERGCEPGGDPATGTVGDKGTGERRTILVDCTDNFDTRQLINQECVARGITLVSASAAHFQGQLLTVDMTSAPSAGCYHCLFPAQMQVSQTCQTVGVLGPMVGVMASMQALVCMHLLLGATELLGKLFRFDGASFSWREASLSRDETCAVCVDNRGHTHDLNYPE